MKKLSKKNKLLAIIGIAVFALTVVVNIQYALDGYGISKNSLHTQVLAQTSSDTGTSSGGVSGGLIPLLDEIERECSLPIGGGGSNTSGIGVGVSSVEVTGWIKVGGSWRNPDSWVGGHYYSCTFAWACCTPVECIPY
jgi:hypothetical protein